MVWIDGELVALSDARVSPMDRGIVVGDGVFETLRVYDGTPFAWRRHYERLEHSARGLGLPVPSSAVLRAASDAVLAANGLRDARLRITVTAGEGPPGSGRAAAQCFPFVIATSFTPTDDLADVVTVPWTLNEHGATAGLKTVSYAGNVRALAYAHERGATEALFANTAGNLCEATGSNVFVVLGGVLHTPPPSAGCLLGVTRGLILELAAAQGMPFEELDVPMASLRGAEEAFLSSTTREVQPIRAIDGVAVPHAPGPVGSRLQTAFRTLVAENLDP